MEKYEDEFYGIDLGKIRAVLITNKDRSERNNQYWTIKAVTLPMALDCPYTHYVIVHASDWMGMEEGNRILLVAESLQAIDQEELPEGKVKTPDMKGFSKMLRTFGPDFLVRGDVPNILEDKITWKS